MSPNPIYILDANVFIEAAKRYYALDFAPGFWNALVAEANSGRVMSIDKVKHELHYNSAIRRWVDINFQTWFDSTSQNDVIAAYTTIMQWANSSTQYTQTAKAEFASNADGWLIAYSLAKGHTLVTHEVFDANSKKRIKIPNVCIEFSVPYTDTYEMLRDLNIKWL